MAGNQETFQKAMSQGHSAAWEQHWREAADYYAQALEIVPDHPIALTSLGLALFELSEFDKALQFYQRAAQFSPNDPIPLEKMAQIYERQGRTKEVVQASMQVADVYLKTRDVDKAIENWNRVLAYQPENLVARTRLAMVYERLGRKEDAVAEYLATASLMQRSGDVARALQIAEYAMQIVPTNQEAQQALIMLRNNQPLPKPGKPRGASPARILESRRADMGEMTQKKSLDPIAEACQKAMVRLAAILFDQGEDSSPSGTVSRRGFGSIARGTGGLSADTADRTRITLHLSQAIDSQSQDNLPQATEELERAVDIGLNNSAAYFDLGFLYQKQDGQKALRHLQKSVKHPDYALASYLLMGQIHLEDKNYTEAATAYLQAMRLADAETVPEEQVDELLQLYEPIVDSQVRTSDTKSLAALCLNIANQLMRSDWREFLKMARQQLPPQAPDSPPLPLAEMLSESSSSQVVEALAQVRRFASENKHRSAMEEAYHALQQAPTYLPLHIQIGELLLEQGRMQDAVEKFLLVAELYNLRGESAQAIRLLTRVTRVVPMDLVVRSRLIEALNSQGRVEEAIKQYIELAEIYYRLAELDMARQTYASALKLAQQAKVSRELSLQILNRVADIDMQRLDLRQAVKVYEQIRTMMPEDENAHFQLVSLNYRLGQDSAALAEADGYVALLENSGRRKKAMEFLQGIIADRPERLDIRKRLADVFIRNGNINEAVEQLDVIAEALMVAGNRNGAMTMLNAIIAFNPPNVNEYRAALSKMRGSASLASGKN
ncbi:MAG: tetratricopeptide repeat protein [Anaerolineaceae bacterium]|nr:tetratricopeptide repeat protein [Anaerolineaceae bacterium]